MGDEVEERKNGITRSQYHLNAPHMSDDDERDGESMSRDRYHTHTHDDIGHFDSSNRSCIDLLSCFIDCHTQPMHFDTPTKL